MLEYIAPDIDDLSIGSLIKSDIFLASDVPTIGINVFPKYPA
jgi:hypothetical protein